MTPLLDYLAEAACALALLLACGASIAAELEQCHGCGFAVGAHIVIDGGRE